MSPEGKPKPNLPENRPNASMPETKLDAILTATRDRVASLRALARAARDQGLGILVEVHSAGELELALAVDPTAVGVNSRDLATFAVDLGRAERLVALVPGGVPVIAESGIATRPDVERMAAAGADLVLVGTSVAGNVDPEGAVRELTGVRRQGRGR